jgi:two-component system, LytTR family, response regulator
MEKYNCVIADDNILERDALEMHLKKIPQLQIVSVCENGYEALQAITSNNVDLVFSDIEMPELSGFGVLKALKKAPVFVFISSHGEFAIESYNLDVIDFIVKPVTFERLLKAVNKAIEYLELKNSVAPRPQQQPQEVLTETDNYFFIRETNDLIKMPYDEVAYIESMGDFSKINTVKDKRHITLVSLKNLELQLPSRYFTRIHKQFIINHHHITSISGDEVKVAEKYVLPISQSMRQELLDKVVNHKIVTRHISK